jgi:twitching motility protein PilT
MELFELSVENLVAALIERGLLEEETLTEIFGSHRRDMDLNVLERTLVSRHLISDEILGSLKGEATGFEVVTHPSAARPALPRETAVGAGALVMAGDRRLVAFIDPSEDNIRLVGNALGTAVFETAIFTAHSFDLLFAAAYGGDVVVVRESCPHVHNAIEDCLRLDATDLHIQVGSPPFVRLDGRLQPLDYGPVSADWMAQTARFLGGDRYSELEREKTLDFAFTYGDERFRMNLGHERHGWTLSARLLAATIPLMSKLGLPLSVQNFTSLERGLILVTGPTGSGKSTTLAAILQEIARTQDRHLITLEDPIEYVLEPGELSVVKQRELHEDFVDFPSALRQALRQDPDVVLVGEMRDTETARTAVTAAETGHLVFSTLHTYDAQSTVARLVSMYPEAEQDHAREKLAYILKGVVSQTLVSRATGAGRVAAMEIMLGTPAISNNLRHPKGLSQIRSTIQTSRMDGMQTMEMALADLHIGGAITYEDALFKCRNKEEFEQYLSRGSRS